MKKQQNAPHEEYIPFEQQKIINVEINKEMKKSFLDYSMAVIVSRALPDVRDGLKPVHRASSIRCMKTTSTPKRRTANVRIPSVRCWDGTTRTAMRPYTTPWCVWRRAFPCGICS